MNVSTILTGALLLGIHLLAALPWVAVAFFGQPPSGRFGRDYHPGEGTASWGILGGLAAMAGATVWFFAGLALNRVFVYPAVLFVLGLVAVVQGFGQRRYGFGSWLYLLPLIAGCFAGCFLLPPLFLYFVQERDTLEFAGKCYAAVLQLQLTADFFVLVFLLLLKIWPKGGAVALAAFREGIRQPMYWLLTGSAFFLLTVSPFIPYFTFGEDHIVVKELGYDTIMLVAVLFGVLAACLFVSEEIEGRTAVTLLSKPVSRRQFLLGKYVGILLAALLMFGLLGCYFESVVLFKYTYDKVDPTPVPEWLTLRLLDWSLPSAAGDFLRGAGLWAQHTRETLPGLVLAFSQVMVLVSVAVALATRVPMVVNLSTVLVVFFLSHLTPVLLSIGRRAGDENPGAVSRLLGFVSQLFDTVLPDLGAFRLDQALVGDTPPPVSYLGSVTLYGLMYTATVLLFGLILFEDRDLA